MHLTCLSVDAINVRRLHQLKQPATPPGPVPETAPLGWAAVLKFSLLLERFRLAGTHTRSGLGMWTSIFKPREHLRHQAKVRDGFLAQNNQGMDTSISAFARITDRETWAEHPPFLPALNLNMNMNEDEPSLLKRCDPINRTPERPAPPEHVAFQPEVAQFPSLTRTPDLEKPKHPPSVMMVAEPRQQRQQKSHHRYHRVPHLQLALPFMGRATTFGVPVAAWAVVVACGILLLHRMHGDIPRRRV